MLKDKNILLGITGGIAAYKSAYLIRHFIKSGANVKVIITPTASNFIGKLTLATLSKNPVYCEAFDSQTGQWNSHIDLGLWADAFIIAPATANTIAKMAHGIADNLLLTTYLSARCPVFLAPAMDLDMYNHPATQKNLEILSERGNIIIEPAEGELASGLSGKGRMQEPEEIVNFIAQFFEKSTSLNNITALVTAGPTYELIDPVRFIGNFSSGKMGYAIAEELARRGADVILISGPTHLKTSNPKIKVIKITSALEMFEQTKKYFPKAHLTVLAAAVADYRPANPETSKIKKSDKELIIKLIKNPDIAQHLGQNKQPWQTIIGFALETDNELQNALEKLQRKNFDFIVLNSLKDKGAGFGHDTNKVKLIFPSGKILDFPLKSKAEVAKDIIEQATQIIKQKNPNLF